MVSQDQEQRRVVTEDLKEASRGNNSRSIRIWARSDSVDYTRDRALAQARWNVWCGKLRNDESRTD